MENTGRCNWELYDVLPEFNFTVFVINPLHLSKSQGLVRGKNDKEDAYRITLFTEKNKEDLSPWKPSSLAVRKIKGLMTERNAKVKTKRRLNKQKHDYKKMRALGFTQSLTNWNLQQINQLDKQIKKIDELIQQTIDVEPELKKNNKN